MRVLMQNRLDAVVKRGGDLLQMEKPIPHLRQMGIEVDISYDLDPDLTSYDILHVHNITRVHETYRQVQNGIKYKKPIVVTPLYNSREDYVRFIREGKPLAVRIGYGILPWYSAYQLLRSLYYSAMTKTPSLAFDQALIGYHQQQKMVLGAAAVVAPNSRLELEKVKSEVETGEMRSCIVPYGVEIDRALVDVPASLFREKYRLQDFVLCIGRIEPLKNQVRLMRALRDRTDVSMVFVGQPQESHPRYVKKFMDLLRNHRHFHWLGSFDRPMLFSAIKNAHVVALPSWFETCGLPGLEGGVLDANIVMTNRGYTSEYYGSHAWYCDPNDENSLRLSVLDALGAPRGARSFSERILTEYTWRKSAEALAAAYNRALSSGSDHSPYA